MAIEFSGEDTIPEITCDEDHVFIYGVVNQKHKILKIGQSRQPRKRLMTHKHHFKSYAGLNDNQMVLWISSKPIPVDKNPEAFFIKIFKNFVNTDAFGYGCISEGQKGCSTLGVEGIKSLTDEFYQINRFNLNQLKLKVKEYIEATEEL